MATMADQHWLTQLTDKKEKFWGVWVLQWSKTLTLTLIFSSSPLFLFLFPPALILSLSISFVLHYTITCSAETGWALFNSLPFCLFAFHSLPTIFSHSLSNSRVKTEHDAFSEPSILYSAPPLSFSCASCHYPILQHLSSFPLCYIYALSIQIRADMECRIRMCKFSDNECTADVFRDWMPAPCFSNLSHSWCGQMQMAGKVRWSWRISSSDSRFQKVRLVKTRKTSR